MTRKLFVSIEKGIKNVFFLSNQLNSVLCVLQMYLRKAFKKGIETTTDLSQRVQLLKREGERENETLECNKEFFVRNNGMESKVWRQ